MNMRLRAIGNITAMKDSAGGEVQYIYDAYSRLLEQKVVNGITDPVTTAYTYNNMGSIAESEGYQYAYDLNGNLTQVNTPEGAEIRYFYDAADRLIRTEEDVQVDTLDIQDNSAHIRYTEEDKTYLYPDNSFMCEVVTDFETSAKSMELVILYEEDLLEVSFCMPLVTGVVADTSTPGVIKLTTTQSISSGEQSLCYVYFKAKEAVTGTAYVAVALESTVTNYAGEFLFSECTGLLMDVCLPDYNEDGITDLRDFTLLAKQYYAYVDDETEKYDITGNGLVDDADLDYIKELLFAGITEADELSVDRVADRTLQTAYTVKTKTETRVTTYEYNAADQVTKVTDCNGSSVYYDYDSCGRLVKMTDQAGYVNEIVYDTAGNPVKVVLPEGVEESYTYDTNGSLLTVTDALGAVTTYGYDVYGRTTSITDAVGVTAKYQYDIAGNVTKNLFTGEEYCYNAYDEVVSYIDAEGNVTTVQYDSQGNITSTTDALGNITAYTYRKDGLLTEIKDASGAVTLYEYDNKGRVSKETDALRAVTTYEYDSEDRIVKLSEPNGTVTEYTYNTEGSVTKVTAVTVAGEREELRYLYAQDGSLTASISSTDILEYTYDKRGYVKTVEKNNSHKLNLVYDGNGNLALLKELTTGKTTPDNITSYKYDARGYLTEVYTGGTLTYKTSGYDRDGYAIFSETAENGELLASYTGRADGLIEQVTDGAGNVTKYQYNQQKQVIGLTVTAVDGTVVYSEANTYDNNGSLLKQVVNGEGYDSEKNTYTYDALDRLLSETKNGQTTSYTYDSMGNRLTKTENGITTSYVYDLCNKLLSETTGEEETAYNYDALGNLTAKTDGKGTTTYAYDALNQLAEVVNPDGTWQTTTYDASGIRSMIAENGVTTEFMTFNGLVLSGYNKDGEQTEHYYYGNSLLTAEYTEYATDSYGEVAAETSLYYYLKNSHGDVIGLTDNNGTLTETYRYDAFGTLTSIQSLNESGVLAETEIALSRFLYAGEQYDEITGLYYLRARQYDTVLGRFTQEDTYLGDGRNLYVYVSNNPLKYVDPSGHDRELGYTGSSLHSGIVPGEIAEYRKQQEEAERLARLSILNDSWSSPNDYAGYHAQRWGNYLAPIVENDPVVSLKDTMLGAIDALLPVPTSINEYVTYQEMYVTGLMFLSPISAAYGGSADNINDMFKMGYTGIRYAGEYAVAVESTITLNAEMVASVYMYGKNSNLLFDSAGTMYSNLSSSSGSASTGVTPVQEKTIAANGLEYKSNPKHTPGQIGFRADAGIEPKNSLELFGQSVASTLKQNQRFTYDEEMGILHRFFEDGNGVWHWSGSTHQGINSLNGSQILNDIKRLFDLPRKGW